MLTGHWLRLEQSGSPLSELVITHEPCRNLGVSSIIGIGLVAIGTSLPELVTSIIAALKSRSLRNIVGSNIFVLVSLPITAIIYQSNGCKWRT